MAYESWKLVAGFFSCSLISAGSRVSTGTTLFPYDAENVMVSEFSIYIQVLSVLTHLMVEEGYDKR